MYIYVYMYMYESLSIYIYTLCVGVRLHDICDYTIMSIITYVYN